MNLCLLEKCTSATNCASTTQRARGLSHVTCIESKVRLHFHCLPIRSCSKDVAGALRDTLDTLEVLRSAPATSFEHERIGRQ